MIVFYICKYRVSRTSNDKFFIYEWASTNQTCARVGRVLSGRSGPSGRVGLPSVDPTLSSGRSDRIGSVASGRILSVSRVAS